MKRFRLFTSVTLASVAVAAGCSLVNEYDDIKPRIEGNYATGEAPPDDATAPDSSTTDAPVDANDGGSTGSGGAIVVSAKVFDDAGVESYVLAVLDPANGHELGQRESMIVASIRYDGLRDLWYVFESTSKEFSPPPGADVILHVRNLDAKTGAWTELSKTTIPAMQSYDSIGVVRERIGYVAFVNPDAGSGLQFITLDTSNPASISIINRLVVDLPPVGVVSSRSTTGQGGTVNLVRVNVPACSTPSSCPLELVPVRIPNGASSPIMDPAVNLGTTSKFATPSIGVMNNPARDLVITPRVSSDAAAPSFANTYDPQTHSQQGQTTQFLINDSTLRRAAVDDCTNTVFVVGTNGDVYVHAVAIQDDGGGGSSQQNTGHSGQAVYFEPTSKTVLSPFAQGAGKDFSAYKLGGTPGAPTMTKRMAPDWEPPDDLRPILLGIRLPLPVTCP